MGPPQSSHPRHASLRLCSPALGVPRTRHSLTGGLLRKQHTQGHWHGMVHTTDILTELHQSSNSYFTLTSPYKMLCFDDCARCSAVGLGDCTTLLLETISNKLRAMFNKSDARA